jgi:hypothetical protein
MENSLQAKLAKVEDAHYEQAETDHIEKHADERRAQAYMFLGGAMAIDKLQNHLASQVIGAIMTVEEQKLYLEYGYDTFADFLSKVQTFHQSQKHSSTSFASFILPKARHDSTSSPIGNFR